jgi:ubiquinone/menaquinone biosynthesis C-methylase UbiE
MNDLDRLRKEYAEREHRFAHDDRYSPSNAAYRFMKAQLNKDVQNLLRQYQCANISIYRILEVGCGNGNVLMDFHQLGAKEQNLFGVDLLPGRLQQAHTRYPTLAFICADGQDLPYPSASFDLVMQYTAFSSILDDEIRVNLAREMLRVLNSDGMILWYDFWLNPTNPQTRGVRPAEIRSLFPGCRFEFQRITLAPPIARRLVPISWLFSALLEKLNVFNTHYLVAIRPV